MIPILLFWPTLIPSSILWTVEQFDNNPNTIYHNNAWSLNSISTSQLWNYLSSSSTAFCIFFTNNISLPTTYQMMVHSINIIHANNGCCRLHYIGIFHTPESCHVLRSTYLSLGGRWLFGGSHETGSSGAFRCEIDSLWFSAVFVHHFPFLIA